VRIVVSPAAATVAVGATRHFTATGHFTGGLTQNITQWVDWSSSLPNVASAANAAGDHSRVDAVGVGAAAIAAADPLTGITSTDSGDDAMVTVGRLNAITLAPAAVTLPVGSAFSFTTTGALDGGATINLTQEATYASSDPTVATATNLDGNRSRVVAVASGTATITAHRETPSSFSQATDGNAVTVTVTAAP
jgi:uncharacterized protein YjdB